MTRVRLAVALGVLAVLAVLATAAVALATYRSDDRSPVADPLVVADPASTARFEVPAEGWVVRGPRSRIFYEDDRGQPVAEVTGPAVYDDGYCDDRPGDSNRGFAGFTEQTFGAWSRSLGGAGDVHREPVVLADGSKAGLRWARLPGGSGPCSADGIELAMVSSDDLRVVLVADAGEDGTLAHDEIVRILSGARAS